MSHVLLKAAVIACALSAFVAVGPKQMSAQSAAEKFALYVVSGNEFSRYDVSVDPPTLTKRESITMPGVVQYAWPSPSLKHLYAVWSAGTGQGAANGATAFDVEPGTGKLTRHGDDVPLKYRPIHTTVDRDGTHLLVVYNNPSALTVFNITPDGSIGSEVPEPADLHLGNYTHQVKVAPSNKTVTIVGRGNYDRKYDPGTINVFDYKDGVLSNRQTVAPPGGLNFNPRHLDFDASGQWVYVSLEAQHMLQVYKLSKDGMLSDAPVFSKNTLADPAAITEQDGEETGPVHVSPNGRMVYTTNRGTGTVPFQGKRVFAGGEDNMAVFQINRSTGDITLVQNIDTHGFVPRTFALDPSGRILVAGNQNERLVRNGDTVTSVPASLALYRVLPDGKLEYVRNYPVDDTPQASLFWIGINPLPH
jgi:6-phosphogluconolactonase (cycloisomerase 2 family)